ncbi:MAG: hypothetical protein IKO06_05440, partial [Alphaproteobacteria bacterium]|nr:hypothetical protein [Alphaproteobacteria bacterium]
MYAVFAFFGIFLFMGILTHEIATSPSAPRNDNAASFFDSAEMHEQSNVCCFCFFWDFFIHEYLD